MGVRHAVVETTLGEVTLVADGERLIGLYFPHHWYRPPVSAFGSRVDADGDALFASARTQLTEYLDGARQVFDLPIDLRGDEFQRRVWSLLAEIPYGQTTTYGELADQLGDRSLAQQVGQAVGRNPLCMIVACHRVIGRDGALTGYVGGLRRKRALLALEEPRPALLGRLF